MCFAIALLSLVISCGLAPRSRETASVGYATRGWLRGGVALPERGAGYVRARRDDDTRWAAPRLRALLERVARTVEAQLPGGAPLVIGDLSARDGGGHARHGSHRTGRDADLLFYLLDHAALPRRGSGFFAFDERGIGAGPGAGAPARGTARRGIAMLDVARNWALVRALVLDEQAPVQWIFCADGIKARLLAYAGAHERDPRALIRAAYVLHQPTQGNPHRDHFHVRIACTASERTLGCLDAGPLWPWHRLEHEKPERGGRDDDASLLRALLVDVDD